MAKGMAHTVHNRALPDIGVLLLKQGSPKDLFWGKGLCQRSWPSYLNSPLNSEVGTNIHQFWKLFGYWYRGVASGRFPAAAQILKQFRLKDA